MELLNKYLKEVVLFLVFIILGFVYKYSNLNQKFLLSILSISYILFNIYLGNLYIKSIFTKALIYFYFILDTIILLVTRLDIKYLFINLVMYILIILLINHTEGFKVVKKSILLFILYTFTKIFYVVFLIN